MRTYPKFLRNKYSKESYPQLLSSTSLLNLTPEVLEGLKEKHQEAADTADESLLYGPIDYIPLCVCDLIDEKMIFDAATKTKGSTGPSGMNAELYRRILCSKNFKAEGKVLREEIAVFIRNLLKIAYHPSLLEGYTSCRLIRLYKNPAIRLVANSWKNSCWFFEGRDQRGSGYPSGLRRS